MVCAVTLRVFGAMSKSQTDRNLGCLNFWDLPGQYGKITCRLSHCEPKPSVALFHVVLGNAETLPKGEPWTEMPDTWCGEQEDRIWQWAEELFGRDYVHNIFLPLAGRSQGRKIMPWWQDEAPMTKKEFVSQDFNRVGPVKISAIHQHLQNAHKYFMNWPSRIFIMDYELNIFWI